MPHPPLLSEPLSAALTRAAGDADLFVVGGYIRDRLMGRLSPDLDVIAAAEPALVARRLAGLLEGQPSHVSAEHGSHRVTLPEPVDGIRHIDVTALRGGIEQDLALRDCTINAIAWRPGAGELVDPTGGVADIDRRRIRLVSADAVRDDPVRALRAVRLAAELGFQIDDASATLIRRDASLLARTAGERQRDELARVLETPVAAPMLRLTDRLGLLDVLIPELTPSKGCIQPKEHYFDVFDHLIETVAVLDAMLGPEPEADPWRGRYRVLWQGLPDAQRLQTRYTDHVAQGRTYGALLKLAGLLHDVSKPQTRSVQPNGRVRFFGHDDLGAHAAAAILQRLRCTTREIRLVELLIKDHLRPGQLSSGRNLPTRRALFRFFRDLGDAAPDLLLLNLADHAAARGPAMPEQDWVGHVAYIRWILERRTQDEALVHPPSRQAGTPAGRGRLLTGHDLMAELGLPPGPIIGRLLEELEEARAVGRVRTREQALALARCLAGEADAPAAHTST